MDARFTLNDLIYTSDPIEEAQRDTSVDPNYDRDVALEESRRLREEDARLLREFRKRTKDLAVS